MNIRIIAIGKIKEDYLKLGIKEYLIRLKQYVKTERTVLINVLFFSCVESDA